MCCGLARPIGKELELLDVVVLWEKPIGSDWFAMLISLRTTGLSCSWAEPPLLTRVCYNRPLLVLYRAGLPPPPVLRCASNPCCVAPASTSA
jgi:hypothetical protein